MIANPSVPAYRYGLNWDDPLGRGWDSLPLRSSIGQNFLILWHFIASSPKDLRYLGWVLNLGVRPGLLLHSTHPSPGIYNEIVNPSPTFACSSYGTDLSNDHLSSCLCS